MKKISTLLLSLSLYLIASEGIKELNYEVDTTYSQASFKNNPMDNYSLSLGISANIPIKSYIALQLGGSSNKAIFKEEDGDITYKDNRLRANIFIRDSSLGKLGINYTYRNVSIQDEDVSFKSYSTNYSIRSYVLYGDYYFNNFTFRLFMGKNQSRGHTSDLLTSVKIKYYFQEDTLLGIYKNQKTSREEYSIFMEHQLENIPLRFGIAYANSKYFRDYTFLVTYHFNSGISLKRSDREYR